MLQYTVVKNGVFIPITTIRAPRISKQFNQSVVMCQLTMVIKMGYGMYLMPGT